MTQPGQQEEASRFTIVERDSGIEVALELEPAATLMHFPIETVSESEQGLERTYQGLCLVCLWRLPRGQAPGRWDATVRWTVS
jgi:alpha-amylase